jgi:NAD(P)-dependent dehydrogenase (short-subunit alcohol dehydrogenase family)
LARVSLSTLKQEQAVKNSPIVLITGASRARGIGFEVARQLGAQGMTMIVTARDAQTAQERANELKAAGHDAVGHALDVTSDASVQALAATLTRDYGRLDVLINNAALMSSFDDAAASADLARAHAVLDSVVFGSWRVTQALLPLLHKSDHPRVVNVSSGAGSHGDPAFGLTTGLMGTSYPVAKAALNALTVKFAHETKAQRVLVNAVCPGFTATFDGAEQMGARPVKDGAASVVWAVNLPDDGPTGGFFRDGQPLPW